MSAPASDVVALPPLPPAGETRQRIIETALRLFAEHGFRGVSVRDLSTAAQVNVAAINYHFGSKQGLYRTIFETVLDEDEVRFAGQIDHVTTLLGRAASDRDLLRVAVESLAGYLAGRLSGPDYRRWFGVLVARELAFPSELFDLLYHRRTEPVLRLLAQLVGAARGLPPACESVCLTANLLHGHMASLVLASPILRHQLGWDHYSEERLAQLTCTITDIICSAIGLGSVQDPKPPRAVTGDPA